MFSSNKSLVISTLLTGTAVATGTLLYGAYFSEEEELIILNDTLPPVLGNGLLPPPATYVMKTPPPADIPGIRRLKIARPSLDTDNREEEGTRSTASTDNDEDFYLTGTRSAELIRAPVEARIETFPTITLEEAVEGALAVDEWGFQVVQSYLSQAMGDGDALKARMDAMLTRIEEEAGNYDLATISDAANLIIEAGARTHWTAFMAPFVLDESFKLQEGAIGWDFGPSHLEPYDKFTRVGAESKMLVGADNMSNEGDRQGPSILRNGVHNVEQFVATGLKNGRYRVVILTAPRPNGRSPLYPFGVDVKRNGGKVNIVDTRSTDGIVPVMKLSTGGPGRLSDVPNSAAEEDKDIDATTSDASDLSYILSASASAPLATDTAAPISLSYLENNFDITQTSAAQPVAQTANFEPYAQSPGFGGAPATGHMLVTRAEVTDGTLRISFRQLGGQDTYVTAVIIYPEPDVNIEEDLAEEIVEFLEKIAPAAGENLTAENILQSELPIVDAVTIFSDASGGLPTPEAQSATPEADNTPGTPEPAPEPDPEPAPTVSTETTPEETPPPPEENPTFTGTDPEPTPEPPAPEPEPPVVEPEPPAPEPEPPAPEPEPPAPEPEPPAPEPEPPAPEPEPPAPEPEPPEPEPEPIAPPPVSPPVPQVKELVLDAGGGDDEIYDPVILGNPIELQGCGSTFENEVVCQLANTDDFEIVWLLDGQEMGTGTSLTIQTGTGTQFDTTRDNINITAQLRFDGLLVANGTILSINSLNDTSGGPFLPGDLILTSLDTALISIIAAPVSEPGALFLLAPGLVYVANRERRRRKKKKLA